MKQILSKDDAKSTVNVAKPGFTPFGSKFHRLEVRAYRRCTVGKILIVAKISDKCVGRAKWKPFSSPVNATLVVVGVLGECF